jgi:hypothetical protein
MPFYEMIFEVGEHSILNADSDEAVAEAAKIQHQRAKSGLPNGPAGDRADRVVRILKYDDDPGNVVTQLSEKEVAARLKEVLSEMDTDSSGNVNLEEVARTLVPQAVLDTPVHESNYAMQESGELDPALWGGEAL